MAGHLTGSETQQEELVQTWMMKKKTTFLCIRITLDQRMRMITLWSSLLEVSNNSLVPSPLLVCMHCILQLTIVDSYSVVRNYFALLLLQLIPLFLSTLNFVATPMSVPTLPSPLEEGPSLDHDMFQTQNVTVPGSVQPVVCLCVCVCGTGIFMLCHYNNTLITVDFHLYSYVYTHT